MKFLNFCRFWVAINFPNTRKKLLLEKEQKRLAILEIRRMAFVYGIDLENCTDEELIENISSSGKKLSKMGVTTAQAAEAMRRVLGSLA